MKSRVKFDKSLIILIIIVLVVAATVFLIIKSTRTDRGNRDDRKSERYQFGFSDT